MSNQINSMKKKDFVALLKMYKKISSTYEYKH